MSRDHWRLLRLGTAGARAAGALAAAGLLVSCGVAVSGGGAAAHATAATAAGPLCTPGPAAAGNAGSSPQGQMIGGQLNAVAALPGAGVWAAGSTSLGNPLTAHWDGKAWASVLTSTGDQLTSPSGGYFNGMAVVSAGDAWAVGEDFDRPVIIHWNGTAAASPSPS